MNLEPTIHAVNPVVIVPPCMVAGHRQNCCACPVLPPGKLCNGPRSLCRRAYPGHPNGCPAYGRQADCPPNAPMFWEIFRRDMPCYAIVSRFAIGEWKERMAEKHKERPDLIKKCHTTAYLWQSTAKKRQREAIAALRPPGTKFVTRPEACGVMVYQTMEGVCDIQAGAITYRVAMGGTPR